MGNKTTPEDLAAELKRLQKCAGQLRSYPTSTKNNVLMSLAELLKQNCAKILSANALDTSNLDAQQPGYFRERLTLTPVRIEAMSESLRQTARLTDPVGVIYDTRILANGLKAQRVQTPLGVIFMIFESRPNVITEAFSLAFKSGNAIILRGGRESKHTAHLIYELIFEAFKIEKITDPPFFALQDYNRDWVNFLLKQKKWIDVVVPRGGDALIEMVQSESLIPIIKNDRGLCHVLVDENADFEMALNICINAKTQRPSVCNSIETVLVHKKQAAQFFPELLRRTESYQLEFRCEPVALQLFPQKNVRVKLAGPDDFSTEYLSQILNCKVVNSLEEGLEHIREFGSKHSESLVSPSQDHWQRFKTEVDAAAVYWNASTRFTDGFELGLGGELGISTQKLHVRGPVSLQELTSLRWIIEGQGQIRT